MVNRRGSAMCTCGCVVYAIEIDAICALHADMEGFAILPLGHIGFIMIVILAILFDNRKSFEVW